MSSIPNCMYTPQMLHNPLRCQRAWLGWQVILKVTLFLILAKRGDYEAQGIYHGTLNFESTSDDLIDAAQLLPYPSVSRSPVANPKSPTPSEVPMSIALTKFHFLLLYRDRIVGVCNLNEKLSYEERLPLVWVLKIALWLTVDVIWILETKRRSPRINSGCGS